MGKIAIEEATTIEHPAEVMTLKDIGTINHVPRMLNWSETLKCASHNDLVRL